MQKETIADYQLNKNHPASEKDSDAKCGTPSCPVLTTLSVIGGKWKPAIIWSLLRHGTTRFGALRKSLPGITQKMLTQQLRELEADGIVAREVYAEVPPRVEYSLTAYGKTLTPIMDEMANWGGSHQQR